MYLSISISIYPSINRPIYWVQCVQCAFHSLQTTGSILIVGSGKRENFNFSAEKLQIQCRTDLILLHIKSKQTGGYSSMGFQCKVQVRTTSDTFIVFSLAG